MDSGSTVQRIGFDSEKYLQEQTAAILERIALFDNKLYLEFGGKLLFDYHASRVLPGFDPNAKLRLLQRLKERAEIILCIHAGDIERRKMRADFGITYESDAFKLIDDLGEWGLTVRAVVITRFTDQPTATAFKTKLERRGVAVYVHRPIPGYLQDIERTLSDTGFGANPWIETERPLVVVTAPGPNSGKMGTCLSQIYHEHRRGARAGYAKFETFPIWNLPLKHPVNGAYEAATVDLRDVNLIDPFHLEAHGVAAVNYNRDVEAFPVLRRILERISGAQLLYRSPTDMGVNRAGYAIVDDAACCAAARQEILRRYFLIACEYATGHADEESVRRSERLLDEYELRPEDRPVVRPSLEAAAAARARGKPGYKGVVVGAALQLPDGDMVTGTNSPLMHAAAAVVLNAVKRLAGLPASLDLLAEMTIDSIGHLKKDILGRPGLSLDLDEVLIALSISSTTNPTSRLAMEQLRKLRRCECHLTHMPTPGDERALKRLGLHVTSVPNFETNKLFVS